MTAIKIPVPATEVQRKRDFDPCNIRCCNTRCCNHSLGNSARHLRDNSVRHSRGNGVRHLRGNFQPSGD